ncbi:MAG: hypothetical protein ACE5KH_01765 [Candidatus Geothermarchaeales archaeon]
MVEINYQPLKKIVVLDRTEYALDQFVSDVVTLARSGQHVGVLWAEGVLFVPVPMPLETDRVMDDLLGGTAYWSGVMFTLKEKYESTIKMGGIEVPVMNATPNQPMRDVARWLRESSKQSRPSA